MHTLILLRHGESIWNKENRFTGWTDVDLSKNGEQEASHAADLLGEKKLLFDIAYTSYLKRAIRTLSIVLERIDQLWVPVRKHWRLNERHYGSLQGLNKADTAKRFGQDQVQLWRRSYDVSPPAVDWEDSRSPLHDRRYSSIPASELPLGESLKDTVRRVVPFWKTDISATLQKQKRVLIVAHGNSLRALIKYLDKISDKDIVALNIPTGIPLVYELNDSLTPITHYYLEDEDVVARTIEAVKQQGHAK